ncbi:MAG: efflux RND transporter permease subunit, partial [Burkholderiales bacterium]
MWIVQLALRRPYTFIVLALLILLGGTVAIVRTPVDIFPNINIPVVSVVWRYTGLASEEMEARIVAPFERALTATVNDIERIESQTVNGVGVVKVFFHPGASIQTGLAQVVAISQTVLGQFPPGATPPLVLSYNASTVPIVQLVLSSKSLAEHELLERTLGFRQHAASGLCVSLESRPLHKRRAVSGENQDEFLGRG